MHFMRQLSSTRGTSEESSCELDSHADTCVAGSNCVMLGEPSRTVTVHPYSDEYKPMQNIPIGTAATVWVDPSNGTNYLLLFHESIYFGDRLGHTLLCPNQMRDNGLTVHDVPKQYELTSTHSITIPGTDVSIPLQMRGVISCFETHKPTDAEVMDLPRIEMTSPNEWNPNSKSFSEEEERHKAIASLRTNAAKDPVSADYRLLSSMNSYDTALRDLVTDATDEVLFDRLVASVTVASDDVPGEGLSGHGDSEIYSRCEQIRRIQAMSSDERRSTITPEILARRWGISIAKAKKTLQVTTQAGV